MGEPGSNCIGGCLLPTFFPSLVITIRWSKHHREAGDGKQCWGGMAMSFYFALVCAMGAGVYTLKRAIRRNRAQAANRGQGVNHLIAEIDFRVVGQPAKDHRYSSRPASSPCRLYCEVRRHVTTEDEPNMNTIARVGVPGLTKVPNAIQIAVLIALSIITAWMLYMVPSWQAAGDPFLLATIASAVTVAILQLDLTNPRLPHPRPVAVAMRHPLRRHHAGARRRSPR